MCSSDLFTHGSDQTRAPVPNTCGDYRLFWQALVAAVRGEGPNPVPASEALMVMQVLDAGLRSASTNDVVFLKPS